jgi:phosphotransferase system HPr-like phosphotransfer protein
MVKITVLLDRIANIKDFVKLVSKCGDDVIVRSGRFTINAKSIIGLFSLDLTKPLNVELYGYIPYEVREGIKKFIID